jgi:L-fucose isomerase-like protein
VIGKPSDWLIASQVDPGATKEKLALEIVDVPINELIRLAQKDYKLDDPLIEVLKQKKFSAEELTKALNIYGALCQLKDGYQLNGLTVRCFDLLEPLQSTGCIGLALLNAQGIPSACEGDVPSLITMLILQQLVGEAGFMVNPSRINIFDNSMVVAHCTLPINMGTEYKLKTHFESGIGVAVDGQLPEGKAMMFKVDADLNRYFLSEIEIVDNLSRPDLCRTQIKVKLKENVDYFLKEPCGNHHIITLQEDLPLVRDFMESLI